MRRSDGSTRHPARNWSPYVASFGPNWPSEVTSLRALEEALRESEHAEEGLIVVGQGEARTYETEGGVIRQVPAATWLLGAQAPASG